MSHSDSSFKVVLVGPCGVGKSTVGEILAKRICAEYLDFDKIGLMDMEKRKGSVSPFSVSGLDLKKSIPLVIREDFPKGFVLDIGGDTVFRKYKDNDERCRQILWLKETYAPMVLVLTAQKDKLQERFISTKNRKGDEFKRIWEEWVNIAEPNWKKCGGVFIDTTFLSIEGIINQIIRQLTFDSQNRIKLHLS